MTSPYPISGPLRLKTHLADRPSTHAVITGEIASPLVTLDVCGPKSTSKGFKPLVRERAFDVSELSIMTYLQAKAYGKPLVLLPAVVLGRFQHAFLACRADGGISDPRQLEGRRVAIRSYTVTTVTWARAILQWQYGVDLDTVTWVAFEDSHLSEFQDPPNVERIDLAGRTIEDLLIDGIVDAAILSAKPSDERLRPLLPDPAEASRLWLEKYDAIQINHMFVVDADLSRERPDVVRAIYDMLKRGKQAAPKTELGVDVLPFGVETNRRNLEVAIACAYDQQLIPRKYAVEELFDETTLAMAG